jgi:Outer membrane cobalamin receptor protein
MKKHLIHFLLVVALSAFSTVSWAQTTVKGQLVDAESGEPLVGASILVEGTSQGSVTNIDGFFKQNVGTNATLVFRYIGYKDQKKKITQKGGTIDLGVIKLDQDAVMLKDVVISSSLAVARKTPVAVSTVDPVFIEEKLSTQELPEILKSTPGVFANKQGGGYGDSEIYMRGFGNENIAVMVNGVPMNDMEWGGVYWSNWDGLRDVARSIQTQRGLGASKLSVPSIGGTINIITRGIDAKKGGFLSYGLGNDGMNKILFSASSGVSKDGWAFSLLGGKSWGDGYVQGTNYNAYNYYFQLSKRLNENHQLSLTAFGAPQTHYQRSNSGGLTIADWQMVEKVYGVKNYKYNPSYGFDSNGQRRSGDYNAYHKPQISLNHQWQIDYKSSLSTSLYVSIGRGYGYSGQGNNEFSSYTYSDWYGARYGVLQTKFRKPDGTFDYGAIETINEGSEYGSLLAMSKSINNHNWYGLVSTYSTKFGKYIDFYGGVDFRYYKGMHTNELSDLYGGKYFMDPSRGNVKVENNINASSDAWRYQKLGVGDVIYRDYDGYVMQEGGFFQAEYNRDKLSVSLNGALSNTSYWRKDHLYYDEEHAKSKTVNFIGFTAKGGANYNINDNHNVFMNIGYISRAPKFSYGAFLSATTSNVTNKEAKNEKVLSAELGYGWRNSWMKLNVNGYYTKWMDKTMTKSGTLDNQQEYFMNMSGVDALHKGVEVDLKANPLEWLELSGMLSWGDWKWDSDAVGYAYDVNGFALRPDGTVTTPGAADQAYAGIKLKGIRVGGSAQTTAALGANVNIGKQVRLGADWTYQGRNYAYYSFSGSDLSLGKDIQILSPWKAPAASQIDMNASYKFKFGGLDAVLSGNINNLLDYQYISKAYNPNATVSSTYKEATADNVYVFYSFGRTYSVKLRVNF